MPRTDLVLGFAHRGGREGAPENSLQAFALALARGATGLESDVWLDAGGVPVLHHGAPHQQKVAPLRLAELFAKCGTSYDLSLDLKSRDVAPATVALARAAGFDLSRLWLCGGSLSSGQWRALDPQVRLVTDLSGQAARRAPEVQIQRVKAHGIDAVNLRQGNWTAALVDLVHEAGLLAFAWDVQSSRRLRRALKRGVDGVYSDHVGLLVDGLPRH